MLPDKYEQCNANKMDNLGEMDKFFERCNLSRLNQGAIESQGCKDFLKSAD